jgi:Ni,Fe-hydrogenase III small subunit
MRTLQEWMGHRDIRRTEIYADYSPRTRDAELVAGGICTRHTRGPIRGPIASEPKVI